MIIDLSKYFSRGTPPTNNDTFDTVGVSGPLGFHFDRETSLVYNGIKHIQFTVLLYITQFNL